MLGYIFSDLYSILYFYGEFYDASYKVKCIKHLNILIIGSDSKHVPQIQRLKHQGSKAYHRIHHTFTVVFPNFDYHNGKAAGATIRTVSCVVYLG